MPDTNENANIIISRVKISSEDEFFIDWQSRLQDVIANFPGFLSLEILAPNKEQSSWTIVQRFKDVSDANTWKQSPRRQELFKELSSQQLEETISEEQKLTGVTEVIITETNPEKRSFYIQWLSKIHQAEVKVPGFRGVYVQAPIEGKGRYWITFLQFDTAANLDKWLGSFERLEILKELNPLIKSFETHRVISPYAGWFGSIAKSGATPPLWKQTMLILLVLFPIVMLELKFLNPWTQGLNTSLAMFIGNAISVSLISWPMMPIVIYCFKWWLLPDPLNQARINFKGTFILAMIYLLEIIIFWK